MDLLLVDDNVDYLKLLSEALYSNGYTVHTAADGAEGCQVLTSQDIDIIISDIRMPRLDGMKLHRFARETERYRQTKFVFITAYKEVYGNMLNLDPEVDHFLEKSASIPDIVKLVNRLVFGDFAGIWI